MENDKIFAHYITSLAQKSILYEVSTTPKPGLVDRNDTGAHSDMDFFTFISSSCSLYKGLYDCTIAGILFKEDDHKKLLENIRPIGIDCEESMFLATQGINTHKGIIFSLGIICAAVGNLYSKTGNTQFSAETVCNEVSMITKDLTLNDFKFIDQKEKLTHGEFLYKTYGLKGIREEVESGFQTVQNNGLPIIRNWSISNDLEKNDLFLEVLINIMANSQDTNVVSRGGLEGLQYVRDSSSSFLNDGGMKQQSAIEKLSYMNKEFTKKNISPGGSADLLAVTIFLALIEGVSL